jgi:hypothetical protein
MRDPPHPRCCICGERSHAANIAFHATIDDLLDRRHRLKTAIDQAHITGELPIANEPNDWGTELHNPEALGL